MPTPARGRSLPRLRQSTDDRILTGVAAGLGERLGVEPVLVRIAFVVLATAAGAGAIAYWLLWATSLAPDEQPERLGRRIEPSFHQAAAFTVTVLGALGTLRAVGFWFSGAITWPVAVAAAGSAILWARGDQVTRERFSRPFQRIPGDPSTALLGVSRRRALLGGALVLTGMLTFIATNVSFSRLGPLLIALVVLSLGLAFLVGPWVLTLVGQLDTERRERIRDEERAAVAAHLHDSVLQTLALVQRSDDAGEMAGLARRQERELRQWLYGARDVDSPQVLTLAVDQLVDEVEAAHGAVIDSVVVGDTELDPTLREVLAACREALVNAARHAGVSDITLYVEVTPTLISAYIRDRGGGFDPAAVNGDRRGISDSIRGRVKRLGGTVEIASRPGEGTEVTIDVPTKTDRR